MILRTQDVELLRFERFGEEVGHVVLRGLVRDHELELLDHVAHDKLKHAALDVLKLVVVLGVVGRFARGHAV